MERIIEMATKKGLWVSESAKRQNNGKELKTCLFRLHEGDAVSAVFEKRHFDNLADEALEAFFDEHVLPAFEEEIVKKESEAPDFIIDLLRTGTVFPVAINAEANEEILSEIPHRRVMDLALVYRLIVSMEGDAVSSVLYTNHSMEIAGITEEDLFRRALDYAKENIRISNVADILKENNYEFDLDETKEAKGELYAIRNATPWFGGGLLALWALEEGITIDLESDIPLFVLPSSLHEIIVLKGIDASKEDVDFPFSMVKNVNTTQVNSEERLSNSVYRYDPETKKVSLAKCGEPLRVCEEYERFLREMFA